VQLQRSGGSATATKTFAVPMTVKKFEEKVDEIKKPSADGFQ
jgi:hypothetical protein